MSLVTADVLYLVVQGWQMDRSGNYLGRRAYVGYKDIQSSLCVQGGFQLE